jgi:hypothetical protein
MIPRRIAGVLSKLNKDGLLSMESRNTISFSVVILIGSNGVTLFYLDRLPQILGPSI